MRLLRRDKHTQQHTKGRLLQANAPVLLAFAQLHGRIRAASPTVGFPKHFSFIDAPEETLQALSELAFSISRGYAHINIQQRACETVDICAAAVCNALGIAAKYVHGTQFHGTYPSAHESNEIVQAVGLPNLLGVKTNALEHFRRFELRTGSARKARAERSGLDGLHALALTRYLDDCLRQYQYQLSAVGRQNVGNMLSEILANSDEHSGGRRWWIQGYLRQPHGREFGDCHITIFNLGPSIAETMQKLPRTSELRTEIEALVRDHTARSWLGPSGWTEENLWTVYALQEGVSSQRESAQGKDRGNGTVKMIDLFQRLGRTTTAGSEPAMCIVSGHTHLLFDPSRPMRPEASRAGLRVIAFNASNDLSLPPDRDLVRHLRLPFPGTLISMRFYFDPRHLDSFRSTPHAHQPS